MSALLRLLSFESNGVLAKGVLCAASTFSSCSFCSSVSAATVAARGAGLGAGSSSTALNSILAVPGEVTAAAFCWLCGDFTAVLCPDLAPACGVFAGELRDSKKDCLDLKLVSTRTTSSSSSSSLSLLALTSAPFCGGGTNDGDTGPWNAPSGDVAGTLRSGLGEATLGGALPFASPEKELRPREKKDLRLGLVALLPSPSFWLGSLGSPRSSGPPDAGVSGAPFDVRLLLRNIFFTNFVEKILDFFFFGVLPSPSTTLALTSDIRDSSYCSSSPPRLSPPSGEKGTSFPVAELMLLLRNIFFTNLVENILDFFFVPDSVPASELFSSTVTIAGADERRFAGEAPDGEPSAARSTWLSVSSPPSEFPLDEKLLRSEKKEFLFTLPDFPLDCSESMSNHEHRGAAFTADSFCGLMLLGDGCKIINPFHHEHCPYKRSIKRASNYNLFFAIRASNRSLALNLVPLLASDTCAEASSGTGVPL